jgi:hypothetical protein
MALIGSLVSTSGKYYMYFDNVICISFAYTRVIVQQWNAIQRNILISEKWHCTTYVDKLIHCSVYN